MRLPVALLTATLALASSTVSAQTPADADAETAMREGIAATKEGRFEEAAAAYGRAYAVAPRFAWPPTSGTSSCSSGGSPTRRSTWRRRSR